MQNTNKHTTWESLPDTLTAQHIAEFLGISRRRVYELLQVNVKDGGIPNFKIGATKRIDKADFRQWITLKKKNSYMNRASDFIIQKNI